jgi:multidrug efflux pump subunit AcrB
MLRVETAVGSNLAEVDRLMRRVETFVNAQPEVAHSYAIIGNFGNNSGTLNSSGMFITLVPPGQRKGDQAAIQNRMRREFERYPGVDANVLDMSGQAFTASRGVPIDFNLRGSDWDGLIAQAQALMERMRRSGMMVGVKCDAQMGMPELRVTPDRARCADLGVSMEAVATTINALIGGVKAGKFSDGGKRMDIRVRLLADQRLRPEDLQRIYLRSARGDLIPLSALVTTEERPALQAIFRRDRERAVSLSASLAPGVAQGTALKEIEQYAKELPPGYRLVLAGNSASFGESMGGLLWAMLFGVLVAYMVLAAQFNSLLHPVTVLSILPLSLTGAGVALWLGHQSLNVFSVIGMLLLMGIAKKNSIILVDYANRCRTPAGGGHDARGAMLKAGPVRLRPILMTSCATLLAAVPLALGLGPGSELRAPMAIAIIGGVLVSTMLSLLVVPAFYLLADRLVAALGRLFAKPPPAVAAPPAVERSDAQDAEAPVRR